MTSPLRPLVKQLKKNLTILQLKDIGYKKIAKAWTPELLAIQQQPSTHAKLNAVARVLPLIRYRWEVPFLCRYRPDVIFPLRLPTDVHVLADWVTEHRALGRLRKQCLEIPFVQADEKLTTLVHTSHNKEELYDLINTSPIQGSMEDKIAKQYPDIAKAVEASLANPEHTIEHLRPLSVVKTLMSQTVARDYFVFKALVEKVPCSLKVFKRVFDVPPDTEMPLSEWKGYYIIKIDTKKPEKRFIVDDKLAVNTIFEVLKQPRTPLWEEVVQSAWLRYLKHRLCARLFDERVAEARATLGRQYQGFVRRILAQPPPPVLRPLLALSVHSHDLHMRCALMDKHGKVVPDGLTNIRLFDKGPEDDPGAMEKLLQRLKELDPDNPKPIVVVGNTSCWAEAVQSVQAAATAVNFEVDIQSTSESGSKFWSLTEEATNEFPDDASELRRAVFLGRRYLNPLAELVKVPMWSLGKHIARAYFPDGELDRLLHTASVDAVAKVGVDVNTASLELLYRVPGLTTTLAERIVKARPVTRRSDLLNVHGINAAIYQACAGFLRVAGGPEDLDDTSCHPESYPLARFLLEEMKWKLDDPSTLAPLPPKGKLRSDAWNETARKASAKFGVGAPRVLGVMEQLVDSILGRLPERPDGSDPSEPYFGISSFPDCKLLPDELKDLEALKKACPVPNILGVVSRIHDAAIYVNLGFKLTAILTASIDGSGTLKSLMIGQTIGVDILNVNQGKQIIAQVSGKDKKKKHTDEKDKETKDVKKSGKKTRKDVLVDVYLENMEVAPARVASDHQGRVIVNGVDITNPHQTFGPASMDALGSRGQAALFKRRKEIPRSETSEQPRSDFSERRAFRSASEYYMAKLFPDVFEKYESKEVKTTWSGADKKRKAKKNEKTGKGKAATEPARRGKALKEEGGKDTFGFINEDGSLKGLETNAALPQERLRRTRTTTAKATVGFLPDALPNIRSRESRLYQSSETILPEDPSLFLDLLKLVHFGPFMEKSYMKRCKDAYMKGKTYNFRSGYPISWGVPKERALLYIRAMRETDTVKNPWKQPWLFTNSILNEIVVKLDRKAPTREELESMIQEIPEPLRLSGTIRIVVCGTPGYRETVTEIENSYDGDLILDDSMKELIQKAVLVEQYCLGDWFHYVKWTEFDSIVAEIESNEHFAAKIDKNIDYFSQHLGEPSTNAPVVEQDDPVDNLPTAPKPKRTESDPLFQ